jgi:prepilin-type N-terminal cleavage/methylation domain-containing protein
MDRRNARGFTLIEILMALMVLAVGLASVLAVFVAGVRSSRKVVDESAAALSASAVLARILAEDEELPLGERDFLARIETARKEGVGFLWINPSGDGKADPVGARVNDSLYCWRARASKYKTDEADPLADLKRSTGELVPLMTERVPQKQKLNPDSEELWRVTVEIYRRSDNSSTGPIDLDDNVQPVDTYQTYVCTAHR